MTKLEKLSLAGVSIVSGLVIGCSIQLVRAFRWSKRLAELEMRKQKLQKAKELVGTKMKQVENMLQELHELPEDDECSLEELKRKMDLTYWSDSLLDELESYFQDIGADLSIDFSKNL